MPRKKDPNSVSSIVAALEIEKSVSFTSNSLASISVMVSQLKKDEQNKGKKFKIKQHSETKTITVTRVA